MLVRSFFVTKIQVKIRSDEDYITLNVLLKIEDIIETGGMAKSYLASNPVKVNDVLEDRRGRKLYPGDLIEIEGKVYEIVK